MPVFRYGFVTTCLLAARVERLSWRLAFSQPHQLTVICEAGQIRGALRNARVHEAAVASLSMLSTAAQQAISSSVVILIVVIPLPIQLPPLPLLHGGLDHDRPRHLILPHKDIAPRNAVLALPRAATELAGGLATHGAQRAAVAVARERGGLEAEAALDLQAGVARQIAHVPQRVRLALEQRDDNGAARRERELRALEEGDEELLVVAHLPVDVGGLAADVGEVEYFGAGVQLKVCGCGKEQGVGGVLILSKRPTASLPVFLVQGPIFFASTP